MARYSVRSLRSEDFPTLMQLEEQVFGATGESVLGPYYVRVCCDIYADSCFLCEVEADDGTTRVVGYLLSFVKGREAWCTTLAIHPDFQGSRVVLRLIQAFAHRVIGTVEVCWFTVKEDNTAARALHRMLGATEVGMRQDFYGPGDERIVSRIDQAGIARMAGRYARLGLTDGEEVTAPGQRRPKDIEAAA